MNFVSDVGNALFRKRATLTHNTAHSWSYPRYSTFSKIVHQAASDWFLEHEYETDEKHPFILNSSNDWGKNIILPQVSQYILDRANEKHTDRESFALHKYLHHGLSSQALLF